MSTPAVGNLARLIEERKQHAADVKELLEEDPPEVCPECGQVVR